MASPPATHPARLEPRAPWSLRDQRGAIATEYAVVAATCALLMAGALAALGPPILASYQASRQTLVAPEP